MQRLRIHLLKRWILKSYFRGHSRCSYFGPFKGTMPSPIYANFRAVMNGHMDHTHSDSLTRYMHGPVRTKDCLPSTPQPPDKNGYSGRESVWRTTTYLAKSTPEYFNLNGSLHGNNDWSQIVDTTPQYSSMNGSTQYVSPTTQYSSMNGYTQHVSTTTQYSSMNGSIEGNDWSQMVDSTAQYSPMNGSTGGYILSPPRTPMTPTWQGSPMDGSLEGNDAWVQMMNERNLISSTTQSPSPPGTAAITEGYQTPTNTSVSPPGPHEVRKDFAVPTDEFLQACNIENVYADTCADKIVEISTLVSRYPVVCIDTEFPGHIYPLPPPSSCRDIRDQAYLHMYNNVNNTTPIQIGFSLFDEDGNRPEGTCTWQFNMKFTRATDPHNLDSIAMLERHGIDFELLETQGIDPRWFGVLFESSPLSGNRDITWVNFQGAYDFAYLLKCICYRYEDPLPIKYEDFGMRMERYFDRVIDLKYVCTVHNAKIDGGLKRLAKSLGLGAEVQALQLHQAGTDAYLTGLCYFNMLSSNEQSPAHGLFQFMREFVRNVSRSSHIHNPSEDLDNSSMVDSCRNCFYGLSGHTLKVAVAKLPFYLRRLNTHPPQQTLLVDIPMEFSFRLHG